MKSPPGSQSKGYFI
ncbi:MAG: hypothetical protein EBY16_04425 [Gammaproteobacteria bacterium]|nr:hypothetical protein [Gammaproteobacteria bacterium]